MGSILRTTLYGGRGRVRIRSWDLAKITPVTFPTHTPRAPHTRTSSPHPHRLRRRHHTPHVKAIQRLSHRASPTSLTARTATGKRTQRPAESSIKRKALSPKPERHEKRHPRPEAAPNQRKAPRSAFSESTGTHRQAESITSHFIEAHAHPCSSGSKGQHEHHAQPSPHEAAKSVTHRTIPNGQGPPRSDRLAAALTPPNCLGLTDGAAQGPGRPHRRAGHRRLPGRPARPCGRRPGNPATAG